MSKYIESHPEIMIFKTEDYDQAIEVYLKDVKKINKFYHLDSGSNLSVSDILEGRKVALISEDELIFTYTEDNATFYQHGGRDYKVIGIIRGSSCNCITPLLADLNDNDSPVAGSFYIDGGDAAQDCVDKLKQLILTADPNAQVDVSDAALTYSSSVMLNTATLAAIASLLVLIIILCLSTVAYQWADTRRCELFVRLLSGSYPKEAVLRLALNYAAVSSLSLIAGTGFALFLVNLGAFDLYMGNIRVMYTFAAVAVQLLILIIGMGETYLHLKHMCNVPICELQR